MKIVSHRLVQDDGCAVAYVQSPNRGGVIKPVYLIMHYTAGADAESAIKTLSTKKPSGNASAHLVVARNGEITQLVSFNRAAWHAGKSRWRGLEKLNLHSIGIELDNAGRLMRRGGRWASWFGAEYPDDQVVEAVHKNESAASGWHAYTPEQIEAAARAAEALHVKYNFRDVLGHDDIAPDRKVDPGPAFPMISFRSQIMGRDDPSEVPEIFITSTVLNIRAGAGTRYDKLSCGPLPKNTRLEVLDDDGDWRRVLVLEPISGDADVEGWVHGRYIKPAC